MSPTSTSDQQTLNQAIDLLNAGRKDEARRLLLQILKADPRHEIAWMWLVETLPNNQQRLAALEQCLKINPNSQMARTAWQRIKTSLADSRQAQISKVTAFADPQVPKTDQPATESIHLATGSSSEQVRQSKPAWRRSHTILILILFLLALLLATAFGVYQSMRASQRNATATHQAVLGNVQALVTQNAGLRSEIAELAGEPGRAYAAQHNPTATFLACILSDQCLPNSGTPVDLADAILPALKTEHVILSAERGAFKTATPTRTASATAAPTSTRFPTSTLLPTATAYPTITPSPRPTFDPNSPMLLFLSRQDCVARSVNIQGGEVNILTTSIPSPCKEPLLSPDGQKVLFTGPTSGGQIYTMDLDGSHTITVIKPEKETGSTSIWQANWLPDGRRVAYLSEIGTGDHGPLLSLRLINDDGSEPAEMVYEIELQSSFTPVWSPDWQWVALYGYTNEEKAEEELDNTLYILKADGTASVALPEKYRSVTPSWSSDSQFITFVSPEIANTIVFYDTTGFEYVVGFADFAFLDTLAPVWSPDGLEMLLFDQRSMKLVKVLADGSDYTILNQLQTAPRQLSWSPDGRWIAYVEGELLKVMNADGSGTIFLAEDVRSTPLVWGENGSFMPSP